MGSNNVTYAQRILRCTHRKMWKPLICLLVCGFVFCLVALICDYCIEEICAPFLYLLENFYNTLVTVDTILAATVIFYYSIQDKMTGGVPNRTILKYTFGSYSIPIYFMVSLLLLPLVYFVSYYGGIVSKSVCIVVSYIFQMIVIIMILFSNSFSFSLRAICNAEIRQYKERCKFEKTAVEYDQIKGDNPQYIWTYLPNHVELVIESNELLTEKFAIIRALLGTPFYEKEFLCWNIRCFYCLKKTNDYGIFMDQKCVEENNLQRIYEFYYGNLSAVMAYLGKKDQRMIRDKMYLILYEFLERLQNLCMSMCPLTKNAVQNYLMVVSGIMNKALIASMKQLLFKDVDFAMLDRTDNKVKDLLLKKFFCDLSTEAKEWKEKGESSKDFYGGNVIKWETDYLNRRLIEINANLRNWVTEVAWGMTPEITYSRFKKEYESITTSINKIHSNIFEILYNHKVSSLTERYLFICREIYADIACILTLELLPSEYQLAFDKSEQFDYDKKKYYDSIRAVRVYVVTQVIAEVLPAPIGQNWKKAGSKNLETE